MSSYFELRPCYSKCAIYLYLIVKIISKAVDDDELDGPAVSALRHAGLCPRSEDSNRPMMIITCTVNSASDYTI
jgi:hypothetical protein